MKRILAFCGRDWRDPKAGLVEYYMYEVLRRLAAQGHYVVWVCHSYRAVRNSEFRFRNSGFRRLFSPARRPRALGLETVDGIQVARLGARILYRTMVGMFLSRLRDRAKTVAPFDAVLDCVTKRPLDLANGIDAPVVPLVFDLAARVRADEKPPGPVIAVSGKAREALRRSGLPEKFIVTAPYGAEAPAVPSERAAEPLFVVAGPLKHLSSNGFSIRGRRVVAKAVSRLRREGIELGVHFFALEAPRFRLFGAHKPYSEFRIQNSEFREVLQRAWLGYCAPGAEQVALQMGAAGVPVVCLATNTAREYVADGVTGLLAPNDSGALADAFRRLITDDDLRERMAAAARARASVQSWDMTASLVLATIENLRTERTGSPESDVKRQNTAATNTLKV